jgi:hypothetical protein
MTEHEYTVRYDVTGPTHQRAYVDAMDRLTRSLAVGFEYNVTNYLIEVTGDGVHEIEISFEITQVPADVQCNLALHSFFPSGTLTRQ